MAKAVFNAVDQLFGKVTVKVAGAVIDGHLSRVAQPAVRNQVQVLIDCNLAVDYGKLTAESVKQLDDDLKVMISSAVEAIRGLSKESSWADVVNCMRRSPHIESAGDVKNSDTFTKKKTSAFKFDGTPDSKIEKEFYVWFSNLVGDKDVVDICKQQIDLNAVASVVAQSGATVTSFTALLHKHERHEANVRNIGILRFPDIDNPYLKLYFIKLAAFSECDRTFFMQDDHNSVEGSCHIQKFRPCESEIRRMTFGVKQKAIEEAEMLFCD